MTLRNTVELLFLLVRKELTIRYKQSFLGYLWAIANPLMFALVYFLAFKLIIKINVNNYLAFVLTGIFPWNWVSNSIVQSTNSYRNNRTLVKKVAIPRWVLPISNVIQEAVHFLCAVPIVFAVIMYYGMELSTSLLIYFPIMFILQVVILSSFSLIFSIMNVHVHDIEYLIGIFLSLLFYALPIVYPIEMVPERLVSLYMLNPFVWLISAWRSVFYDGHVPHGVLLGLGFFSLLLFVAAIGFYKRSISKIGELV